MEFIKEYNEYTNDNFKKWFGNSKVVDENGNPLVVYHGTSSDIFSSFKMEFDRSLQGIGAMYFSGCQTHAEDYGNSIYSVYLKMENPKIIDGQHKYYDDLFSMIESNIKWAKNSDEFDGVIINNLKDPREGAPFQDDDGEWVDYDSNTVYVVFEPVQIKSATNNNGNFDINNPNINEHYDSPDAAKLNLSDEEIRKMVDIQPYKNKFDSNFVNSQNSAELGDLIYKIKYNHDSGYGLIEYIYRYLIEEIPFLKEFENRKGFSDLTYVLNLNYEKEIEKNLDQKYSAKIQFHIEYKKHDDEILDYKKDTLTVGLYPSIKPTKQSFGLFDDDSINKDFKKDNFDDAIDKIQHKMYGAPDEEDRYFNDKFQYRKENISVDEFIKCIPEIKDIFNKFSKYMYVKYDVKIN